MFNRIVLLFGKEKVFVNDMLLFLMKEKCFFDVIGEKIFVYYLNTRRTYMLAYTSIERRRTNSFYGFNQIDFWRDLKSS
jgi:hypothetical protein